MTFDLVVRNGRVVDDGRTVEVDVGIADGVVAALEPNLSGGAIDIDANGRMVMPGGVDTHVHLGQLSSMGSMTADDFWTGSRSAAHGGTTTIVPFAAQHRGMSLRDLFDDAMARAAAQMTVDYGFSVIVTDPHVEDFDRDLASLAEQGIVGIKIYLTYERLLLEGRGALKTMEKARSFGLNVMVHAEDHSIVTSGLERALAAGDLGARSHVESHSIDAERAGVASAIALAEGSGATVVLAHLSTPDSVAQVVAARARGVAAYAETCPHYLMMDETRIDGPIERAAPFMCSPPLRNRVEVEGLLKALASSDVDIVVSDHSPYSIDQKLPRGADTAFTEVANGLPGIELRLPLLYTAAVANGSISPTAFVDLTATEPAKVAGLYPQKGSLQVGFGRRPHHLGRRTQDHRLRRSPRRGRLHPLRGHRSKWCSSNRHRAGRCDRRTIHRRDNARQG